MHRTAVACLLAAAAALMAPGCASAPATEEYGKAQFRRDMVIAMQLMDVADLAYAVTRAEYVKALVRRQPDIEVAALAKMHSGVSSTTRAIAVDPTPMVGLVQMYIWGKMSVFACENRTRVAPETVPCGCDPLFGKVAQVIAKVARRHISEAQLYELDQMITAYQAENPGILQVGLLRIDDIASSEAAAARVLPESEHTMLSPVTDAARQLEMTRFIGTQLVWLAARLPGAAADEFEGTLRIAMESQAAKGTMQDLGGIARHMGESAQNLAVNAEAQRELGRQIGALAEDVRAAAARADRLATLAIGTVVVLCGVAVGWMMRARRRAPTP
jgi:hypothetical protein